MNILTIQLQDSVLHNLEEKARELHIDKSELIQKAITDFLYFDKLDQLQQELAPYIAASGMKSEDDVFSSIS